MDATRYQVARAALPLRGTHASERGRSSTPLFREHIEHHHPYADAPPEGQLEAMVSSAVYSLEYVPAGAHEDLQEQGFGPEPY
jgi:hypothetical protein